MMNEVEPFGILLLASIIAVAVLVSIVAFVFTKERQQCYLFAC